MAIVEDENGRVLEVQKDGETVWSREEELKDTRAGAIADLVHAGIINEAEIDKIPDDDICQRVHEKCGHHGGGHDRSQDTSTSEG